MRLRPLLPAALAALLGGAALLLVTTGEPPGEARFEETDLSPVPPPALERPALVERVAAEQETDATVATGRVLDADGAPVRGVEVTLTTVPETTLDPDLRWLFDRAPRPLWSAHSTGRTDADGRYSLIAAAPHARTMLRIDSGGPRSTLFSDLPQTAVDGEVDHGTLVLPERRAFLGRVVDPNGRPVPRAIVRLVPEFHLPWEGALSDLGRLEWIARSQPYTIVPAPHCLTRTFSIVPTRRVRTDADGRFRLFCAPSQRGTISIDHQWFARRWLDVRLGDPSAVRDLGEIRLAPTRELEGRVVLASGAPAADVEVGAGTLAIDGSGLAYRFTRTDEDGAFRLTKLLEPEHVLLVRGAGAFEWSAHGPWPFVEGPVVLPLRRGRSMQVRIGDADDRPLAGAELALHPADDGRTAFETALAPYPPVAAPDGAVRVDGLAARPYRVAARAPGFAPRTGEIDLTRGDGELRITLDPECALRVRIVDDATGRGVEGARVVAREVGADSSLVTGRLPGSVATATTDARGEATLPHLAPGRLEVEVRAAGFAPRRRTVRAPTETVIGLARGGALVGRLAFRGAPLAGRRVVLRLLDRPRHGLAPTRIALTRPDGSFAFRGLPPGNHALDLRIAEGYVTGGGLPHGALIETTPDRTVPVAIVGGATAREEVDLARAIAGEARLVHGRLRLRGEAKGACLVQAWVDAPDEGWAAATRTAPDGTFVLGVTDAAAVTVVVDALEFDRRLPVDGGPLMIDVEGAPVVGVVRGRRALAGARVRLEGADGAAIAYTDATGAFRFGRTAPGSYRLHAEAAGHVRRTVALDVPATGALEPIVVTLAAAR